MMTLSRALARKQNVIKNTVHAMQRGENVQDNVHATNAQTATRCTINL
jgi:hypothetical protein